MRVLTSRDIEIGAPAGRVWDYVTDWSRQREWIPMTTVRPLDDANGIGGRVRAWTGVGPVGFWDPMTITGWERHDDGGGRCEVLHTGGLVRGDGMFEAVGLDADRCRFSWSEHLEVPGGRLGSWGWRLTRPVLAPVIARGIDVSLRRLAGRLEAADARR